MPKDAKLLHVGLGDIDDEIWLWAIVDPDSEKETRSFIVHGTGHPLSNSANSRTYVGTAYESGRPLVWHLFEVT